MTANLSFKTLTEHALCAEVDSELFFPTAGSPAIEARKVCAACPVRDMCLQLALASGVTGIWGGTSHRERLDMGGRTTTLGTDDPVYGCGTEAGAKRHQRAGETPCRRCRDAASSAARWRARAQGVA